MEKINFGCVGLGQIFRVGHVEALRSLSEANLEFVCDENREVAEQTGTQHGVKWTTDFDELVNNDNVDAVCVSTPHHLHYQVALAAARAKKHVFCEKPFAVTLAHCEEIIKVCEESNVKLMIGENYLFEPAIQWMKRAAEEGQFGELSEVRLLQASPPDPGVGNWRFRKSAGGGVLLDPGIHHAALARFFMGDVKHVTAKVKTRRNEHSGPAGQTRMEVEDTAMMILEFESGALGSIEVSWLVNPIVMRYELDGNEGRAVFDIHRGMSPAQLRIFSSTANPAGVYLPSIPPAHSSPESYVNEFRHFIDCILNDTTPSYDGVQAWMDMETILAGYQSAEKGCAVDLPIDRLPPSGV